MKIEELKTIIKDLCGPLVAEAVDASVKAQVDPIRAEQTGLFTRMLAGVSHPAVVKEVPFAEKGLALARCIRATAASKMRGAGVDGAIQILRGWGNEDLADAWGEIGRASCRERV